MQRIDVRKLGAIRPTWTVGSWRDDAEVQPDPAPEIAADRIGWVTMPDGTRISPKFLAAIEADIDAIDQPY